MVGYYPKSMLEALKIKKEHPDCTMIMGGTDVMVVKKIKENVIFLNQIEEFKTVKKENGILRIGAAKVYSELIRNDIIPELLKEAMIEIASPAIRNAGTIVGNVCNASPAGDSLPVLYAMNAVVVKAYVEEDGKTVKETRIPIDEFILGVRKIALDENEIVTAIEIAEKDYEDFSVQKFTKVGARKAEAISKLSFTGMIKTKEDKVTDIRITFGSVFIKVVRDKDFEKKMTGLSLNELSKRSDEWINEYEKLIRPIDDQRSTAKYRKTVCLNLLRDFFEQI